MPSQSTASVDSGQLFLLTIVLFHKYNDNSGLFSAEIVVVSIGITMVGVGVPIAGFMTRTKKPQLRGFLVFTKRAGQNPSASCLAMAAISTID